MNSNFFLDPTPLLPQSPIFSGLNNDEIEDIVAAASKYRVDKGGILFHQGEQAEACYLIAQGQIRMSEVSTGGQQVIIHILDAGQLTALVAAIGQIEYPLTAAAISKSLLLGWTNQQFADLMLRHPQLAVNCTRLISRRFLELKCRYRELATERVEQRIALALLRLAKDHGQTDNGSIVIDFQVSRQDLSEIAGTSVFTTSRICKQFEHKGLIESHRHSIVILDQIALKALAETSD